MRSSFRISCSYSFGLSLVGMLIAYLTISSHNGHQDPELRNTKDLRTTSISSHSSITDTLLNLRRALPWHLTPTQPGNATEGEYTAIEARLNLSRRATGSSSSSFPGHVDSSVICHPSTGIFTENWVECCKKGVGLWNDLQEAQIYLRDYECPNVQGWERYKIHSPLFTNRWRQQCSEQGTLGLLDQSNDVAASDPSSPPAAKICSNQYTNYYMRTRQGLSANIENYFEYKNWFSASARTIVADFNSGRLDPDYIKYRGPMPPPAPARKLSPHNWPKAPTRWAEAAFASWSDVCNSQNKPLSNLKYIIQMENWNDLAQDVMTEIEDDAARTVLQKHKRNSEGHNLDFTPQDRNFYVLLGTPIGFSVARLLTQYAKAFATNDPVHPDMTATVKTIARVTQNFAQLDLHTGTDLYDLAFTLQDQVIVPPPPPPDSPPP